MTAAALPYPHINPVVPGHAFTVSNQTLNEVFADLNYITSLLDGTSSDVISVKNLTVTGTLTLPDGATWTTAGLQMAGTYTTVSTSAVRIGGSFNFSTTGNAFVVTLNSSILPTGASASSVRGLSLQTEIGTSTANITDYAPLALQVRTALGYSGVIGNAEALNILAPVIAGTSPITVLNGISVNTNANGQGITSGTVDNVGVNISGASAAAGVGGTIRNTNVKLTLASSSSAGNTDRALWITGNGGAASTKYAIFSDSTAASQFAGIIQANGGVSTSSGPLTLSPTTRGVIVSGSAIADMIFNDTSRGTDLKNWIIGDDGASNFAIKTFNDSFSAVTTAYLITRGTTYNVAAHTWNVSTVAGTPVQVATVNSAGAWQWAQYGAGALTTDASGNITAVSDEGEKDITGPFKAGLAEIRKIDTILYHWKKKSGMETQGTYAGFGARNVESVIPLATGRMPDGRRTLQDRALLAAVVNAVKELDIRTMKLAS